MDGITNVGLVTPVSIFRIGETVRIVDEPYDDCPFLWVEEMSRWCGEEVTIESVEWDEAEETFRYYITEDDGDFSWCENCFVHEEIELPESDGDMALLLPNWLS